MARAKRRTVQEFGAHPVDVYVGQRVRMRRVMCGLSQTALANKIGLTFQQLQKYESGMNRISASKLWLIAQELDAPVQWFFADAAEGRSPAAEFGTKRETLELVRNFMTIAPDVRQHFLSLVKSV
ncbi:MAG: helix-turn-helix transcriptional regulator [Alphaproteobacteria bacterium]|jgi:transcriptional regulator with XRE-family HTH domain